MVCRIDPPSRVILASLPRRCCAVHRRRLANRWSGTGAMRRLVEPDEKQDEDSLPASAFDADRRFDALSHEPGTHLDEAVRDVGNEEAHRSGA